MGGTKLTFDEQWLRDYERRTGITVNDPARRAQAAPESGPKRAKYGNKPTEHGGRKFDSKHEAQIAAELELSLRAGEIVAMAYQQVFMLPGGVKYYADFVTFKRDGTFEVIDAKSDATRRDKVYRLKKRQMRECLGIEIREV